MWLLVLFLTSCVSLGKLLNLSEFQFVICRAYLLSNGVARIQ